MTSNVAVEEQQPTFEDLELLVRVSQLLTLHDLEEVMQDVMSLAAQAVGASKSSLFLYSGDDVDWDYVFTARNLKDAESIRVVNQVMDKGLAGWVTRNQRGAIVADTEEDERWHVFPDDDMPARSAMCAPLLHNGEVIAVLTLMHPEPDMFTNYHLRLLTIIANQATVAIQNTQLFKRLLEKRRQLEAVLQSVPDVLLVLDEYGQFVTLNDGARELLSIEPRVRVTGQPLTRYSDKLDVLRELQDALGNRIPVDEPLSFETHSFDLERDYVAQLSVWNEQTSRRSGTVIIMHDVTTLRNLYRFKDEMLRIVSHDLRSPMAIIKGYVDMLETDLNATQHPTDYIPPIYRSIKRMDDLLEDLLQVRQIDEKGLDISEDAVILDLVHPVVQGAMMRAEQKQQTIIENIDLDETVTGAVDVTLLRQSMDNLAGNAVKYTPDGGEIILRAYVQGDNFYFEVEDNGIGIPAESIPYLFESFYRVNPDRNTTISGAGLGLSFVKSIVERHGGRVWVDSEPGVGSLFGMRVPLQANMT